MNNPEFIGKWLRIDGDISIMPVNGVSRPSWVYCVLGPTGAGKSSFIEALSASSQDLSISMDQPDGYTQSVSAYKLVNATYRWRARDYPVYLVDTPGFSDCKISEIEIVTMLSKWLQDNDLEYVDGILFLTPINAPRLPNSRRQIINSLKALVKPSVSSNSFTFVSTMWDTLSNDCAKQRALSNLSELKDKIFKDFHGAQVEQFMNCKHSALQILDKYLDPTSALSTIDHGVIWRFCSALYDRITNTHRQMELFRSELTHPDTESDLSHQSFLQRKYKEENRIFNKFVEQFAELGTPPTDYADAHSHLQKNIAVMQRAGLFYTNRWDPWDNLYFDRMEERLRATSSAGPKPGTPSKLDGARSRPSRVGRLKGLIQYWLWDKKGQWKKWLKRKRRNTGC